jgi:hypothetical protein
MRITGARVRPTPVWFGKGGEQKYDDEDQLLSAEAGVPGLAPFILLPLHTQAQPELDTLLAMAQPHSCWYYNMPS